MTTRPHPLDWIAPLLVGASAAIVAEVAMAMLIYAGDGFVRSLTTVLAVEVVAFGVGLWSAPAPRPDLVDRLRRGWMLCLIIFTVATTFGVAWSLVPAIGTGAVGQALGLTLLAALPLFGCGTVLGAMGSVSRSAEAGALREPGAAGALGAGLGFMATGLLLPRAPIPASLIVACLVLLSAAGLVYGVVLSPTGDDMQAGAPPGDLTSVSEEADAR
jgi:hypothetical protein